MSAPEWSESLRVLEALPETVRRARLDRGMGYREAGASIGIASSAVHKIENGGDVRLSTVIRVMRWLHGGESAEAEQ